MIHLATSLVNEFEAKYSKKDPEQTSDFMKKMSDSLESEEFLETIYFGVVFEHAGHLSRVEW